MELGVRDIGGVGGGKGWSIGAPCERCRFREGWRTALCIDEGASGVSSAEEEEGGVKREGGFRRWAMWLLLLIGSGASWSCIGEADEADRGRGWICSAGAGAGITLGPREGKWTFGICPEFTAFDAFCPVFFTVCIDRVETEEMHKNEIYKGKMFNQKEQTITIGGVHKSTISKTEK